GHVTGVQTCALPIFNPYNNLNSPFEMEVPADAVLPKGLEDPPIRLATLPKDVKPGEQDEDQGVKLSSAQRSNTNWMKCTSFEYRSEERRVGKERSSW